MKNKKMDDNKKVLLMLENVKKQVEEEKYSEEELINLENFMLEFVDDFYFKKYESNF